MVGKLVWLRERVEETEDSYRGVERVVDFVSRSQWKRVRQRKSGNSVTLEMNPWVLILYWTFLFFCLFTVVLSFR